MVLEERTSEGRSLVTPNLRFPKDPTMSAFYHFSKAEQRKCLNLSKGHTDYDSLNEMLLINKIIPNMGSVEGPFVWETKTPPHHGVEEGLVLGEREGLWSRQTRSSCSH